MSRAHTTNEGETVVGRASDTRVQAAPELTADMLLQQLHTMHELPTLPAVANHVNAMLQDINTPAQKLAHVLEKDQAIVPKLLKLVNSAFYGFSRKITSISHAVMLIGYNTVRNAVVSLAVIDSLKLKGKFKGFDITCFWEHAVAVATVSRYLDDQTGGRNKENSFTAGLVHDVGRILMANLYPERFAKVLETMEKEEITLKAAEAKHFPLQHDAIGGYLALHWNLPAVFRKSIAFHHHPARQAEDNHLTCIVHVADALVHDHLEDKTAKAKYAMAPEAWKPLAFQINSVRDWIPDLKKEIRAANDLLLKKE